MTELLKPYSYDLAYCLKGHSKLLLDGKLYEIKLWYMGKAVLIEEGNVIKIADLNQIISRDYDGTDIQEYFEFLKVENFECKTEKDLEEWYEENSELLESFDYYSEFTDVLDEILIDEFFEDKPVIILFPDENTAYNFVANSDYEFIEEPFTIEGREFTGITR